MRNVLNFVSTLLFVSLACYMAEFTQAVEPPKEFAKFKEWMANASPEELHEYQHGLSANFTEKNGEKANELRLCLSLDQNWKGLDNWVDQYWRKTGVRKIDNQRWDDWIAPQKPGDKPWILALGLTPWTSPNVVQPTDNMMRNLGCLATVYGDKVNVGILDFNTEEFVHKQWSYRLQYGQMAPVIFGVTDGKLYPFPVDNLGASVLDGYVNDMPGNCKRSCGQPLYPAANELTIYWEYAKHDIGSHKKYKEIFNYFADNYNETAIF